MIRRFLTVVMSMVMLCGCGGVSAAGSPVQETKKINLVGDWKEDTDNSSYFYAIIAGNTIEIYMQSDSDGTRSLYWAGSYDEPTEPVNTYSWVSENDFTKTRSAMMASGDETKEFTYEDGVLSFYSKIFGVEATRKLKKVSDTPTVEEMKSTITISQSELKQPELIELGGSFPSNSNYYQYAALVRNPNENMAMQFVKFKVVVKDANGTILAVDDGTGPSLHPGETAVVEHAVDCSGGAVETIDFEVSCDNNDFVQNLSNIESSNFYFNSLNYLNKGSSIYDKSVTGVLINNTNVKSDMAWITALYRKSGEIIGAESMTLNSVQPGENVFQFDFHGGFTDFDTIEFYVKDGFGFSNETVAGYTPQEGLKNENTLYFTEYGVTTEKPSMEEKTQESETQPETVTMTETETSEPETGGDMSMDDFKSKMDSLEEFFNSYAEFMKSYDSSNVEMLTKYSEMLTKYTEAMTALDEIDESKLTPEQREYYTTVMLRINKTLMEATASIQG